MKDIMDALNSVYTDTELTHKDVVILAEPFDLGINWNKNEVK